MVESPFAQAIDFLVEKGGFSCIPIHPSQKFPCELKVFPWSASQLNPMTNWQRFGKVRPTPEEIKTWKTWEGIGIGLPLGELNGVVGLDLDNDVDNLHEQILALLPDSPVKKKGQKGFTAFYKYNGDIPSKLSYSKDGQRVCEVLTNGQQTVCPPSRHVSGCNYVWLGPRLGEVDLPELTLAHVQAIQALFPDTKPTYKPVPFTRPAISQELPVDDMLRYLDAESYESWVQVGMSLKTEYGENGRSLYHQFSAQSTKYDARATDLKWNSFKRTDRTIGSLIYEAKQGGYEFPPRQEFEAVEIEEGGNLRPIIHKELIKHDEDIPEHLLDAPGLVGEVMKYILDTSMLPQPVLALGAAIALIGVIMGHRVRTDSDLRSNVFIVCMARSASGKDHPRKCINKILKSMGQEELLIGRPKSDSGVYKSMKRKKGRAIMLMDEMGRFLKSITSTKAGGYQQGITTALMDIFNAASVEFIGEEYASNAEQGGRTDISQPCMCILGTSIKENVFESLTSRDAVDGFLARWLLFETTRFDIDVLDRVVTEPPELLIAALNAWESQPTNANPEGNIQELDIIPRIVPFTDDAKEMILRYRRDCRKRCDDLVRKNHMGEALWGRAAEHAAKLSLIAHTLGQSIGALEMKWAIELTNNRLEYAMSVLDNNISDNAQEAATKKMLAIIKAAGKDGLTQSQITIKTQSLKRVERNELLGTLLDMGKIVAEERAGKGRPVKVYRVG